MLKSAQGANDFKLKTYPDDVMLKKTSVFSV